MLELNIGNGAKLAVDHPCRCVECLVLVRWRGFHVIAEEAQHPNRCLKPTTQLNGMVCNYIVILLHLLGGCASWMTLNSLTGTTDANLTECVRMYG